MPQIKKAKLWVVIFQLKELMVFFLIDLFISLLRQMFLDINILNYTVVIP